MIGSWLAAVEQARAVSFTITGVEILLFVIGGLFTIGLLILFAVVLRKELKRDRQMQQREREADEGKAGS